MLRGKISPPSGIFLMKNWLSYKDAISIEESIPNKETKRILTAAELPKLGEPTILQNEVLSVVRQQGAGASLFCIE